MDGDAATVAAVEGAVTASAGATGAAASPFDGAEAAGVGSACCMGGGGVDVEVAGELDGAPDTIGREGAGGGAGFTPKGRTTNRSFVAMSQTRTEPSSSKSHRNFGRALPARADARAAFHDSPSTVTDAPVPPVSAGKSTTQRMRESRVPPARATRQDKLR
jgi:hypothetical protein